MNKVLKFFIAPLLLIAIFGALIFPYILGYSLEKEVKSYGEQVPPHAGYSLDVKNYHRGWFRSTADITLHLDLTQKEQNKELKLPDFVNITFSNVVHHGPFIITKNTNEFKFARAYIESTVSNPPVPVQFTALWKFGGSMKTLANAEKIAFTVNNGHGASVVIQGLDAKQLAKHDFNSVDTNFELEGFDAFDKTEGRLKVQNVSHTSSFERADFDFWVGRGETKIGNIKVDSIKNDSFEIQGLSLNQTSDIANGRAKGSIELTINSVSVNDKDYGKQVLSVSVDNLDVESLNQLTEALEQQQKSNMPLIPFGKTYRAMLVFLSKGLHMSIDKLDVNTIWGRLNADIDINLPESQTNLGTLEQVIDNIKAVANILVPNKLVEQMAIMWVKAQSEKPEETKVDATQINNTLQNWLNNGWLIKENDNFKLQLRVENSQILINDKPFVFPATPTVTTNQPTKPAPSTAPTMTVKPAEPQPKATENKQ